MCHFVGIGSTTKGEIFMNKTLTNAVWKMRMQDDCLAGVEVNASLIPSGGTSYQLYVPSRGCHNACVFCNYGFKHPVRQEEILKKVEHICRDLPSNIETLILESSGSFLDDRELPEELQYKIMEIIAKTRVYRVQFETHYKTVSEKKLNKILQILKGHELAFEFGLESTNIETLSIYNKDINVKELFKLVHHCQELGIEASLNVLVGAPLLTIQEQIQDALDTVEDILQNCPKSTDIVLFPINIKDYTLLKHLYNRGRYSIISHWEFVDVLTQIPKNAIDRVYISWWGNRVNEFHGKDAIIHPYACDNCHTKLMQFYNSFVNVSSLEDKQKAVETISKVSCSCRIAYEKEKATQKCKKTISQRLSDEIEKLETEFIRT